jgi:hypothetical protein
MPIRVACPSCAKSLSAPDDTAGRKAKCPKCGSSFVVPGPLLDSAQDVLPDPPPAQNEPSQTTSVQADVRQESATVSGDGEVNTRPEPRRARGIKIPNKRYLIAYTAGAAILFAAIVLCALWTTGFFETQAAKRKAVAEALTALGRIEAAVQVGVNFQQYGQLVDDAQAAVNEAARTLKDGQIVTQLIAAMGAYGDAGTVWNFKIQYPNLKLSKDTYGAMISRYNLPLPKVNPYPLIETPSYEYQSTEADPDLALQIIWHVGAEKLAIARSSQ